MTADRQYHAIVRGQQQGPFSHAEMVQLAGRGEIGPDTMAWTDGMTIWRPLPEVPGLGSLLADLPEAPVAGPGEPLLPKAVDSALDKTTRSQAFVIGAGLFFALIAVLGISNIFTFRQLALLGFWGSAALAYFAYQAWRQEEDGRFDTSAETSFRAAIGAWILATVSLAFGNIFFGILQAGAGALFWLARIELLKQAPESADDGPQTAEQQTASTTNAEVAVDDGSPSPDAEAAAEVATGSAGVSEEAVELEDDYGHDPSTED